MFFSDVWNNVPVGSTLSITLRGDAGFGLAGSHTIEMPNGSVLKGGVTFSQFPLRIPVLAGQQHKVKFDVLFAGGPANINLVAEVVEPDGSIFQQPSPFTGRVSASDKVLTVKLFANG
jgi:hypothetical protein